MSGYNSRVPTDLLLDTGVISIGGVVWGVTRSGIKFNPGSEFREVEYDERMAPVAGLDRKVFMRPAFTGTVIQVGPEDLRVLEAGASGTGNTVTPKPAGALIGIGELLQNVAVTWRRSGGGTCTITFAYAINLEYEIGGTDKGEAEVPFKIEARQDRASGTDSTVPYAIAFTD